MKLGLRELVQNLMEELEKDVLTIPLQEDTAGLHTVHCNLCFDVLQY